MTDQWTMLGTWANAFVVGVAGFLAWLAWKAQMAESDAEARRFEKAQAADRQRTSMARLADYLTSITTGETAAARDRVTAWAERNAGTVAPAHYRVATHNQTLRAYPITDEEESPTRHGVFVLLWALHRAGTIVDDLANANAATRSIFTYHMGQVSQIIADFGGLLNEDEREVFRESVDAAVGALRSLEPFVGPEPAKRLASAVEDQAAT